MESLIANNPRLTVHHTDAQTHYVALLKRLIDRTSPSCIAEEDSEEALMRRGSRSLARPVAIRCGVEHRFCDPTIDERKRIGYLGGDYLQIQIFMHDDRNLTQEDIQAKARALEIGKYWRIRERFWLERISDIEGEVIFVCGDGHIETFTKMLSEEQISFTVAERGIGVNERDSHEMAAGWRFLHEHPDVVDEDF